MSAMSNLATDLELNWRHTGGEFLHIGGQWRITPMWIGRGVELWERCDNVAPYELPWSVLLAFDRLEDALHYVSERDIYQANMVGAGFVGII